MKMIEVKNLYPDSDCIKISCEKDTATIVVYRDEGGKTIVKVTKENGSEREYVVGEKWDFSSVVSGFKVELKL